MSDYKYTKQECIDAVRKFISVHGVDSELYQRMNLHPVLKTIFNCVGSWNEAVRLAGGIPKKGRSIDEIVLSFSLTIANLGYLPTFTEYTNLGLNPNYCLFTRNNLNWQEVIRLAGIPHTSRKNHKAKSGFRFCPVCGDAFPITIGKRRYCRSQCRDRFKQWKYRTLRKLVIDRTCPQCGHPWIEPRETHRGKPKHCLNCQKYYQHRHKRKE